MKTTEILGGWSWYTRMIHETMGRVLTANEMKTAMRMYIGSRTYDQAIAEILK